MRIIAGKWRSRRLVRPKTDETRPMPDRVKEAVFDILGSRYGTPGALPALRVADVFAGGGSLGLEALSRGAASCCFFERNPTALDVLRENLKALDAGPEAHIVIGDAWRRAAPTPRGAPFDLVLLDPPYGDSEDTSQAGPVQRFLRRLETPDPPCPLVVLHHRSATHFRTEASAGWRIVDSRTYGTNTVTMFAR